VTLHQRNSLGQRAVLAAAEGVGEIGDLGVGCGVWGVGVLRPVQSYSETREAGVGIRVSEETNPMPPLSDPRPPTSIRANVNPTGRRRDSGKRGKQGGRALFA